MARPTKPHHSVTVRLEESIYQRLNEFCEDSGQPKTVAIERALVMYIKDYYKKQQIIEGANRLQQQIRES